jgi:hypothetical protein
MKLDCLERGSPDCPLIRLYAFTPAEAGWLHVALTSLASGAVQRVPVHDLPGVDAIGGCRLVLVTHRRDQGVVRKAAPADFECALTPATWDNVAGRVEPFVEGAAGFQWLTAGPDEARLLLSADGHW